MKMEKLALATLAALGSLPAVSAAQEAEESAGPMEEVMVIGVRERLIQAGAVKNVIEKTEVIGEVALEATHAVSLTEALTAREEEILLLFVEGLSTREIADRILLGATTVKWYIRRIYDKLGSIPISAILFKPRNPRNDTK